MQKDPSSIVSHLKNLQTPEKYQLNPREHTIMSTNQTTSRSSAFTSDIKPKKSIWTLQEDELLRKLVIEYGANSWGVIAQNIHKRSGKQCRQRWHNHLRYGVKKGEWTIEQYWILALGAKAFGKRWSKIANYLPGRTDNTIKNQWNCKMKPYKSKFSEKIQYLLENPEKWTKLSQTEVQLLNIIKDQHQSAFNNSSNQLFQSYFHSLRVRFSQFQGFKRQTYNQESMNRQKLLNENLPQQKKEQIFEQSDSAVYMDLHGKCLDLQDCFHDKPNQNKEDQYSGQKYFQKQLSPFQLFEQSENVCIPFENHMFVESGSNLWSEPDHFYL